jgi:DNA polymerase-3 subunit delta
MNNYLLEGIDSYALELKEKELINKDFSGVPLSTYDMLEDDLSLVLEDLDTYGLFATKKVIIVNSFEAIDIESNKDKLEHLLNYLSNSNDDNLLIITSLKLDERKKLTKEIKTKLKYLHIDSDPYTYIKEELTGYKLETGVLKKIIDYSLGDLAKIHNDCHKLKNYKIEDKSISLEDVEELVNKKLGDSKDLTFDLVRAISSKDKKRALQIYHELLDYDVDPISIVGLLASQVRLMLQVKLLSKDKLKDNEMLELLGEKSSYRLSKIKEVIGYYTKEELLELIKALEDVDVKMKTTDSDPNFLIELLIINLQ